MTKYKSTKIQKRKTCKKCKKRKKYKSTKIKKNTWALAINTKKQNRVKMQNVKNVKT